MSETVGTIRGQMILDVRQTLDSFTQVRNANLQTVTALRTGGASLAILGAGMTAVGVGIAAGLWQAVDAAAQFERKLDFFGAVSDSTVDEMDAIRVKALQLGQDTIYSAGQIAESFVELGKAGVSASDIINGIGQAVANLGAAADIPLDTAANIIMSAVQTFGLGADQAVGVADLLAGAANASIVEVEDLGTSLKYVGGVASALGLPIEDVVDALALLGTYGIRGSTAGTSLRQILVSLGGSSVKATKELKDLGIITADGSNKFYDAQGSAKPLSEIFQILQEATAGLSDEQKVSAFRTIFQNRALSAALGLTKEGAEGFAAMNEEISKTTAMEVASERLDNLSGDIEILKGNIETLIITQGSQLQAFFRGIVQGITSVIQWFSNLNPNIQKAIIWIAALTAGGLIVGGAIVTAAGSLLILMSAAIQIVPALRAVATIIGVVRTAMIALDLAAAANPVGLIIAAIAAVIAIIVLLVANWDKIVSAWKISWNRVKEITEKVVDYFKAIPGRWAEIWNKVLATVQEFRQKIIDFFKSIPEKLHQLFLNFTLIGLLIKHWDQIKATMVLAWTNIIEYIKAIPERIVAFFRELPNRIAYFIGFMLGVVVGKILEMHAKIHEIIITAWTNILTFFRELPAKVAEFFTNLYEMAKAKYIEMAVFLITKTIEIYNNVVQWFRELPEKIREFFTNLYETAKAKFIELAITLITKAQEIRDGIIQWFKDLPENIRQFFIDLYNKAKEKFEETKEKLVSIAKDIYEKVKTALESIPGKVKQIFEDAITAVKDLIRKAGEAVKDFASSMWEGFQDGLGIHSPSYIERAMWQITGVLDEETQRLKGQIGTIQNLGNELSESSFGLGRTEETAKTLALMRSQLDTARDYQDELIKMSSSSSESSRGASSIGSASSSPLIVKSGNTVKLEVDWHAAPNDNISNTAQVKKLLGKSIDLLGSDIEEDENG